MIRIGDRVRSYDFPGNKDCYVEGIVVGLGEFEGCQRYKISVFSGVFSGLPIEADKLPEYVLPPVNGTPRLFGGECDGVVLCS